MEAEIQAACNYLGFYDVESSTYRKEPDCLETIKDLIRYLKREDNTCDIRRQLGSTQILQNDLVHIIKFYNDEEILFDATLRTILRRGKRIGVHYGKANFKSVKADNSIGLEQQSSEKRTADMISQRGVKKKSSLCTGVAMEGGTITKEITDAKKKQILDVVEIERACLEAVAGPSRLGTNLSEGLWYSEASGSVFPERSTPMPTLKTGKRNLSTGNSKRMSLQSTTALMFSLITISFLLCYLPLWLGTLSVLYDWGIRVPQLVSRFYYLNALADPLLYGIFDRRVRNYLSKVKSYICCRKSRRV